PGAGRVSRRKPCAINAGPVQRSALSLLAEGKLSPNPRPDKAVALKFLRGLTASEPGRKSAANCAAQGQRLSNWSKGHERKDLSVGLGRSRSGAVGGPAGCGARIHHHHPWYAL